MLLWRACLQGLVSKLWQPSLYTCLDWHRQRRGLHAAHVGLCRKAEHGVRAAPLTCRRGCSLPKRCVSIMRRARVHVGQRSQQRMRQLLRMLLPAWLAVPGSAHSILQGALRSEELCTCWLNRWQGRHAPGQTCAWARPHLQGAPQLLDAQSSQGGQQRIQS